MMMMMMMMMISLNFKINQNLMLYRPGIHYSSLRVIGFRCHPGCRKGRRERVKEEKNRGRKRRNNRTGSEGMAPSLLGEQASLIAYGCKRQVCRISIGIVLAAAEDTITIAHSLTPHPSAGKHRA